MSSYGSGRVSPALVAGGIVAAIAAIVLVVSAIAWLFAFKGVSPGDVCVVQQGGPFDGRGIADVRQSGSGVGNIGIFNHQRCFPATERNYIISADPRDSDSKTVDFVEVPTKDAVNVRVEGQAIFRLTTDENVLKVFYRKFGVRTFDGKHPYDGDDGWSNFLKVQFRPVLDNALREAVGGFQCVALNNTCQYIQNAADTVSNGAKTVDTSQNLAEAQTQIEKTLQADLNSTLGGAFFEGIRFRLRGVKFAEQVQTQITAAQAKRTEVATATLEAQRAQQEAKGKTLVAEEAAKQIKVKAQSYKDSPAQAEIDKLKALCGSDGCRNLQVLGGSATKLLK